MDQAVGCAALPQRNVRNRLLATLDPPDFETVRGLLTPVELKPRQVLHLAATPMEHVYFIERGLVSVSTRTADEQWVEIWLTGSEGMTGTPVLLGDDSPPFRHVVQVGGSAYCMSSHDLKLALAASRDLRGVLGRYADVVLVQTSQSGACNAQHDVRQRLSRWLLLARDALGADEMPLTHRMLARLLGVRRASVTGCLGVLEAEGAIRTSRGLIRIADPRKLASMSCDCHRLIRSQYQRLIGQALSRPD